MNLGRITAIMRLVVIVIIAGCLMAGGLYVFAKAIASRTSLLNSDDMMVLVSAVIGAVAAVTVSGAARRRRR